MQKWEEIINYKHKINQILEAQDKKIPVLKGF